MEEVSTCLKGLGFSVSKHFDRIQEDKRFGKSVTHVIQLYGHEQLARWMAEIGFRNPKHLRKLEYWKKINKNNAWAKSALELIAGGGLEPPTSRARV